MKRTMIGILIGAALTTLCVIPLVLQQRSAQFENGKHQGEIFGRLELWESLNMYFGNADAPSTQSRDYIGVKDVGIFVVEKNGVLTIETK